MKKISQIQSRRYLVVTSKPWNKKLFDDEISKFPGYWKLIDEPYNLKFETIEEFDPRYIFFIHWSHRVSKKITDNFQCICFHMTNLPYGRGGSPLQNLIIRGQTSTVISAIRMNQEIDSGPIFLQTPLSLAGNGEEIFIRAGRVIAEMILTFITKELKSKPQCGRVTLFERREPCQSQIPEDANLNKIFDWIRMLDVNGYPPAFVKIGNLRIEFKRAALRYNSIEADARIFEEDDKQKIDRLQYGKL